VAIVGHTDTKGTRESNTKLASARAEVVKSIVIDAGVAPELIAVTSLGESKPLVATPDNVDEPRNRRVEVVIH
jgi:outer membrane protein OmpA-like peptidoglycan-associated protein